MINQNSISNIHVKRHKHHNICICYIEKFSTELEEKIREKISSLWHGAVDSKERTQFNYRNTIKRFLERYETKTDNTKKGMIGELLTHLLIPQYTDFEAISIMKNKEENSIRKGFDIVYCNKNSSLWYCEVKSGGDENLTEDIDKKNLSLLNIALGDIQKHSMGDRATLWDSVLIDVNSTIFSSDKKINIKKLLDDHHPDTDNRIMDRNVILSSVLYKGLEKKISPTKLDKYKINIDSKKIFIDLLIFSIQKETYLKIESFLIAESRK